MTATSKTGCERTERVAEYALRALPASERSAFEEHVNECPECRQELGAVRPIMDAFVDWPTDILRPPTALWGRLAERIAVDSGVAYPPHTHAGVEELHLLDGELWIGERKLHPGDYNRAEPGTRDSRVWSETGCTCVLLTSPGDILR